MATHQPTTSAANHHAHHRGFAGPTGLLVALSMVVGRDHDADLAIELTGLTAADHVVDIGCGPGAAARRAARAGARVTGVDPARVMLRVAGWFNAGWFNRAEGRITYVDGRAEDLPIPDRSATVVWSIASVHHWLRLEAGLAEARRVLEPGGRFLAIERRTRPGATGLASHGWTDQQAEAFAGQCQLAGLTDVNVGRHRAGRRSLVAVTAANR